MARFTTTTATSLTVALVSGICLATSSARGAGPEAPRASVDLAGHWIYNVQLSDDAREKMRQGTQGPGGPGGGRPPMGPGGGGGGAGTGGRAGGGGAMGGPPGTAGADDPREAMGAIMEPAEELTITESGAEVEVDEKFGRLRRLHPDGKKYKTDNGAAEIKASWKDGKLLVETKRTSGASVIESWERAPDGRRLIVSVRLEGGFGPKLELKRIYDRAPAAAERPQK
jgi:hypothetical protein